MVARHPGVLARTTTVETRIARRAPVETPVVSRQAPALADIFLGLVLLVVLLLADALALIGQPLGHGAGRVLAGLGHLDHLRRLHGFPDGREREQTTEDQTDDSSLEHGSSYWICPHVRANPCAADTASAPLRNGPPIRRQNSL